MSPKYFYFFFLNRNKFICLVVFSIKPLCIVYDTLMNVKLPRIRRRDIGRRFELLRRACHKVAVRGSLLILLTLALTLLRCFCSRYKFPVFLPQENPIAAHPSQFVRVSFVELQYDIQLNKMISISALFIVVCASIEHVVADMSGLAVL